VLFFFCKQLVENVEEISHVTRCRGQYGKTKIKTIKNGLKINELKKYIVYIRWVLIMCWLDFVKTRSSSKMLYQMPRHVSTILT